VTGTVFSTLTWLRAIGGTVFLFGGVVPLVWFVLSRGGRLVPETDREADAWSVTDEDPAGGS
jgi:nitric oxide reductase subunit B